MHWSDPSLPEAPPQGRGQGLNFTSDREYCELSQNLEQGDPKKWPHLLKIILGLALVSGLAGLVWGSHIAAQTLKVRLETKVEEVINRPVHWGRLRGVSPSGIHLGKTTIPLVDENQALLEIETINITFDWRGILHRQMPRADVTLVQPHLKLVQDQYGAWPSLSLPSPSESLPAEVIPASGNTLENLRSIRIREGKVTLATRQHHPQAVVPRSQVLVEDLHGSATIRHESSRQPVEFSLRGRIETGGFKAEGQTDLVNRTLRSKFQTHNLPITGGNFLLPPMVGVESGALNSNLQLTAALGKERLIDVSTVDLRGSAILSAGTLLLGQLPDPVSQVRSTLWFEGNRVTLHDTKLQIGDLALSTAGRVSLADGYDLLAQISAIEAMDIQNLVGQPLPGHSQQALHWQARVTGALQDPSVEKLPSLPPTSPDQLALGPEVIGVSLGMGMVNLPLRDRIPLIEGATYAFLPDGAWFTLTDGTVVPPLSRNAYERGAAQLNAALSPGMDRKFFWLLQSSPYITAIAADLGRGDLREYLNGNRFDTDRFFIDYFIPVYRQTSYAAGLDPGEALWMLDHALRTLQDPLLRTPDATPITSGSGTVGSFWEDEQLLSMQQLLLRPQLAQGGQLGKLIRFALLKHLDLSTSLTSRRLASTPEVMSKLPNVTFGAEEGAIAHALGIVQFQDPSFYPDNVRTLANGIVQNELEKQRLRSTITGEMRRLASNQTQVLGDALASLPPSTWNDLGLPPQLSPDAANQLNGTNTLSVLVSRSEKAGYPLPQAYQNSRALLLELLQDRDQLAHPDRLVFAFLKDQAFTPKFWELLAQQVPFLADDFHALRATVNQYRQFATQGSSLHEQMYAAMVQAGEDISVRATIKHAVGFQAHLASLIDQAFAPGDLADPRYRAFRRTLAIYLREAPDISVYGGTEAALRLYGYETLNVQEMLAVDVAAAPRIRALARLYQTAWQGGMINQWDVPGFQRILLTGSLLAAGVERSALPRDLAAVGFPSAEFRRDLLFAVGPEGIKLEATRLGVQAHDHRVGFQPVAIPRYRAPSLAVTDPNSCPTQPEIQAIALGPNTEFVWYPTIQRVVLKRGYTECPIHDHWSTLFFDTLLETAPVVHSPAGAADLQAKLLAAQLLEAGIF